MNKLVIAARVLLGLPFLVFGLNGFFEFMEQPEVSPEAGAFLGALTDSGYLMPLLKGTEVACGALLLTGLFVPLALTVLAPVMVNILGYHVGFGEPGTVVPLVLTGLGLFLAFAYRAQFAGVLAPRAGRDRDKD